MLNHYMKEVSFQIVYSNSFKISFQLKFMCFTEKSEKNRLRPHTEQTSYVGPIYIAY